MNMKLLIIGSNGQLGWELVGQGRDQGFGNVLKGRPQAKRLTNVKKSPSPLMGEGWGEGEKIDVCQSVISPSP